MNFFYFLLRLPIDICQYDGRFTIVNRIKAGKCEVCGAEGVSIYMHHVRSMKALTGKDIYEQKMLELHRKSLALCPDCFAKLHMKKP